MYTREEMKAQIGTLVHEISQLKDGFSKTMIDWQLDNLKYVVDNELKSQDQKLSVEENIYSGICRLAGMVTMVKVQQQEGRV